MSAPQIVPLPKEPDESVAEQVAMLERLLAEAKTGNFDVIVAIALTHSQESVYEFTRGKNLFWMLGCLARLQHETQREIDASTEPE
jgi:hypothetical protein